MLRQRTLLISILVNFLAAKFEHVPDISIFSILVYETSVIYSALHSVLPVDAHVPPVFFYETLVWHPS